MLQSFHMDCFAKKRNGRCVIRPAASLLGCGRETWGGLIGALLLCVPGDACPGYDAKDIEAEDALGKAFLVGLASIGVFDDVLGEPL